MGNLRTYKNDKELWNRFKQGDEDALKIIYYSHFKNLYNYGRKFSSDQGLVEDCIQNLYVDLINKKEKLGDTDNIKLYLLKSVKRRIIRKLQNEKHIDKLDFSLFDVVETEMSSTDNEKLSDKLRSAIDTLSSQQREIIYLKYFNFLGNKEIAEVLDINYQTVRNVLVTALKKLRKSMGTFTFLLVIVSRRRIIAKNFINWF